MARLGTIAFFAAGLLFQAASSAPLNVERSIALSQRSNISVTTVAAQPDSANNRPTIVYVNGDRCGTGLVDGVLRLINGLLNGGDRVCREIIL